MIYLYYIIFIINFQNQLIKVKLISTNEELTGALLKVKNLYISCMDAGSDHISRYNGAMSGKHIYIYIYIYMKY